MFVYRVVMNDSSVIEVYADYAESAEKIAEEETGKIAIWAELGTVDS